MVFLLAFSFLFVLAGVTQLRADEKLTCPVSGKEITNIENAPKYEYKGKTYYFCCENCKEAFMKDPEKYIQVETHEGHMHAHAEDSAYDPTCSMKIKKTEAAATYEYNGETYYFCSEQCKDKFAQNPEKYIQEQKEQYVTCPVSGEIIRKSDAAGTYEYNGKTYYFCCSGCKEKFVKNPENYVKKDKTSTGYGCAQATGLSCCAVKKEKKS